MKFWLGLWSVWRCIHSLMISIQLVLSFEVLVGLMISMKILMFSGMLMKFWLGLWSVCRFLCSLSFWRHSQPFRLLLLLLLYMIVLQLSWSVSGDLVIFDFCPGHLYFLPSHCILLLLSWTYWALRWLLLSVWVWLGCLKLYLCGVLQGEIAIFTSTSPF